MSNMDPNHSKIAQASPIPHAICVPFPAQSHIKAMLKLAKLLHHKGFHITFINTEYNHKRFLKSASGGHSLGGARFSFETIPDGLPPAKDPDASQDILSLGISIRKNFLAPLLELVSKINDNARSEANGNDHDVVSPPVSCFVADGFMSYVVGPAARELGVPLVQFFPISACSLYGMQQYRPLVEKGLLPFKDESSMTNGYLDTIVDRVPGMKGIRLRDLPSFCRTTNVEDIMFNYCMELLESLDEGSVVVIQTFDALEQGVLNALSAKIPNLYTIGPLQLLLNSLPTEDPLKPIQYNLWKEENECLKWLDSQKSKSVVYVNFGSITVLTPKQVAEFGWGLANSNYPFLFVVRPDLVIGESACLSPEFLDEIKERSLITGWCPQEDVLNHPSIGGFLMHCGWNSVIESLSSGVPFLCYPFFADQHTNCWLTCNEVGVSMEIDNDVKRSQVEELVRELMEGEKGEHMRSKATEMKKLAEEATSPFGSSS